MKPQPADVPAALLVSPCAQDRVVFERLFQQQNWKLSVVETYGAALTFLSQTSVPLVISERDLPLATWKDLLRKTRDLSHAPLLVVMSRLADEYLWSEVLNLGGYDVLAKPLCESETLRVMRHAFAKSDAAVSDSRKPRVRTACVGCAPGAWSYGNPKARDTRLELWD